MATTRRRSIVIARAAAAVAIIALALYMFEAWFAQPGTGPLLEHGALNEAQKKALDIALDLTKSFMTWAFAIIGGASFFLKLGVDESIVLRRRDVMIVSAVLLLCVASLYFGQLAMDLTVSLLSVSQFPLNDPRVRIAIRSQYIMVLAAVSVFGIHVFDFFWMQTTSKKVAHKA
jgi:hypothetical protein